MTRFKQAQLIGRSCPGERGAEILWPTGKPASTPCSAVTYSNPAPIYCAITALNSRLEVLGREGRCTFRHRVETKTMSEVPLFHASWW